MAGFPITLRCNSRVFLIAEGVRKWLQGRPQEGGGYRGLPVRRVIGRRRGLRGSDPLGKAMVLALVLLAAYHQAQ
jgi:hypothetical protein